MSGSTSISSADLFGDPNDLKGEPTELHGDLPTNVAKCQSLESKHLYKSVSVASFPSRTCETNPSLDIPCQIS